MTRRWNVFELGRMRHLDLLALYFRLHPHDRGRPPGKDGPRGYWLASLSKERLIAAITGALAPPPA